MRRIKIKDTRVQLLRAFYFFLSSRLIEARTGAKFANFHITIFKNYWIKKIFIALIEFSVRKTINSPIFIQKLDMGVNCLCDLRKNDPKAFDCVPHSKLIHVLKNILKFDLIIINKIINDVKNNINYL